MEPEQRSSDVWLVRVARGYWLPANPLRRSLDRVESTVVMLALLVGLAVVPVAASTGAAVQTSSSRSADLLRATGHRVTARTLVTAGTVGTSEAPSPTPVRVAWMDEGERHKGTAFVSQGTKAHTKLTLWVDAHGRLARTPHSDLQSASLGFGAGALLLLTAWLVLWAVCWLTRMRLDRRRQMLWEADWRRVAPHWTGYP